MGVEFIGDAWKAYKKNFGVIILSVILIGLIFIISFVPFLIPTINSFSMHAKEILALNSTNISINWLSHSLSYPGMFRFYIVLLIALGGIFFASIITFPFVVGQIALLKECLKKEGNIKTMFDFVKEKFWSAVGVKILLLLIIVSAMAMLSIFFVLFSFLSVYSISATYILSFLTVIAFLIFLMFFRLVGQSMAVNKTTAMEAISESFEIVKSNFLEFLSLILLFSFISVVFQQISHLQYIGFLFSLAIIFLINPIANLTYTAFFIKKSKKKKSKK